MQYTDHYNLNLPEGSDIVNPLIQDNPNYTAIDTALYANKLRVIGNATETKIGTAHTITRLDTDIPAFKFIATGDYDTGDTFTVDGVSVSVKLADGKTPKNKAFIINSTVLCILDGTILNIMNIASDLTANDIMYDANTTIKAKIDENFSYREATTLGSTSSIVINCGFRPKKITCFAHCGDNIRRSIGISSASGNYILDFTTASNSNGSAQGNTGLVAYLRLDGNNYRNVNIDAISDTSITFTVTGVGYGGDSTPAIYDFYLE